MSKFTFKQYLGVAVVVATFALFAVVLQNPPKAGASIGDGQAYQATSTRNFDGTAMTSRVLKSTAGTLGSLVITGANTGTVNLYNATTSNVNLRTGQKATSTILIASFPASAAAGTYTFDVEFVDGLYIDIIGAAPTSTPTWK